MELNKILERGLKLACLIPTQCTGKASCSYCTSPTSLPLGGPRPGCQLPSHTASLPAQPQEALHSLTCTSFPFILITDKEKMWGKRKKQNKSQPSWDLDWYLCEHVLPDSQGQSGPGSSLLSAGFYHSHVFDNHFRMKCCVNATI